jgi:hypothetical protein
MRNILFAVLMIGVSPLLACDSIECCYPPSKIELTVQEAVNASFDYRNTGIKEKNTLHIATNSPAGGYSPKDLKQASNTVLMIELAEDVIRDASRLSKTLRCENQLWFWELVENTLSDKFNEYPVAKSKFVNGVKFKKLSSR